MELCLWSRRYESTLTETHDNDGGAEGGDTFKENEDEKEEESGNIKLPKRKPTDRIANLLNEERKKQLIHWGAWCPIFQVKEIAIGNLHGPIQFQTQQLWVISIYANVKSGIPSCRGSQEGYPTTEPGPSRSHNITARLAYHLTVICNTSWKTRKLQLG